jgi:hypothetical protein
LSIEITVSDCHRCVYPLRLRYTRRVTLRSFHGLGGDTCARQASADGIQLLRRRSRDAVELRDPLAFHGIHVLVVPRHEGQSRIVGW